MKKLLVLSLVLAMASLANAALVSATGTVLGDGYVYITSDGTMSNFAVGADSPTDAPSTFTMSASDATGMGLPGFLANGEIWSVGTYGEVTWPKAGTYLTANVALDVVVGTGSTTSVTGTHTTSAFVNQTTVIENVVGGYWTRIYDNFMNSLFEDSKTDSYNQLGANVDAGYIADNGDGTYSVTSFGSQQLLGTRVITGTQLSSALLSETASQTLVSEVFTAIPEPATMALLGLGGLFFARRK